MRRKTSQVKIQDGLFIGSEHPIVVQSMTNTPTADIERTAAQIKDLYLAGSSMVRLTIKDEASARVIPLINSKLRADGLEIPLVGDFHYNGHLLLDQFPECASTLSKYRINPGNVGYGDKHDYNFDTIIKIAKANDKAVRIGVNWGSLDQDLLTEFMERNDGKLSFKQVIYQAMKESALRSAELAMQAGLAEDKIIISVKMSEVHDLINVYREVAKSCNFPLHLGLTEAGTPVKGMISSAAALAILLNEGIGDTIRMSLTPSAGTGELADRALEVRACQELLQALELAYFKPSITSCPGCGRTSSTYFQQLAEEINQHVLEQINTWKPKYPGVEKLKIAVMGCIVNGPGESKYADIGISLPGDNEDPVAPVYIDGKLAVTLRGDNISNEFKEILENYICTSFRITKEAAVR
ncbi:MAG: flavodoxin-dependent (E)-4-hydroxy-3-methylbut-2-enyl-diphosphate synthase [Cyanobacteria bacterium]|nr:flavodoxin-dependent (E)-4-hydroxy-3-methylbut-2-enyl-diphosphate synthase [Cyanobacteriota bacterium]MDA1020190.1 flavodoxin-dependent (E)-4-hydroxy-3-methylbut-2-enyl-diphosphate synthase [Cyanobacteriota bacterium]